ncbi:MAG: FG-GAP repeat domain-containing protein [Thermoanaerobaculia bacterium]
MRKSIAQTLHIAPVLLILPITAVAAFAGTGFVLGWNLPVGAEHHWVALGDVDGDLDVDAYVTEFYGPDTLWLNDGDGNFSRSGQTLDSGYGSCALLARLDNNSSLDLFLVRHLSDSRVWTNDGSGILTDSGQSLGAGYSRHSATLGDVDGDLDLDAYLPANSPTGTNELFLNDGSGTFSNSGQSLGSYPSRAVALGNVDTDTDLDALIGNNGANKLWINDGSGNFTDSGQTVGTKGTFGVGLADLDGDTDLDAFFANGSTSGDPNEVWLNNGSGTFSNSGQSLDNDYSFSVVLFLCDSDSDLDAFVGNSASQPNRLYLNNGSGVFTDSGQSLGTGGAIAVAASDLDGDLDIDLFVANINEPAQLFWNDGACHFSDSGQLLGGSAAASVALGDIDGDGDRDALIGGYSGITRVFRNDGTGNFTDDNQWLVSVLGAQVSSIRLVDLDDDDDLDIWAGVCCTGGSAPDDPGDRIWWNDGSGQFTDSGQLLGSDYTLDVAIGDVDGDLDPDIVVANYPSFFSPGTNRLYRNDGNGVFAQDPQSLGTANNKAIALGRLDADPDLDLFVGVQGGPSRVWSNNGAGVFTLSPQMLGNADTNDVALGDLNGDGDLDAFLGNSGANTVWFNNGSGLFADSMQALGTADTTTVHLIDVDGDQDLDAWTTNGAASIQQSEVWINDGTGHFTASGWALPSLRTVWSASADLDGNFSSDLFLASFDGDHQVWINQLSNLLFADGFEIGDLSAWSSHSP